MRRVLTLCMIRQGDKVLLGKKKRGFAVGLWNGFGGKLEEGETVDESMVRETKEECRIDIITYEKKGIFEFHHEGNKDIHEVHVYECTEYEGEPIETEEMRPQWFSIAEIPYKEMWGDDAYWYPLFLAGKKFKGSFWFDTKQKVVDYILKEVDSL